MIEILSYITSKEQYKKDPLAYIATLTCNLIQDMTQYEELNPLQEVSSVIAFGELLLYSCLDNLHFEDIKDIEKIYNIIHEKYEESECILRQSLGN